jgi:hypothetical protein
MGVIKPVPRAKLFVGMLTGDPAWFDAAREVLVGRYGPIEQATPDWPFTASDYYREELGDVVRRRFFFFETLIEVSDLPAIKHHTNQIETEFCTRLGRPADRRPINLDPGYLTLSKVVLATTKDYGHRLYLGEGIYGEVTLRFAAGRWQPWPWTYADYAAETYHPAFLEARDRLKRSRTAR